uniref:Uncharacterized protein n=1 Tax=Pyrodinium bahamense TaxID=73915 RepID=A0A7S0FXB6_9DINO|mmetsp:Transcript_50700/g.140652  ORF Transcript_50700/g.140652 Transcript_50700/m.140652 type:complete len:203 (+) Transcript_50700:90-698(+)
MSTTMVDMISCFRPGIPEAAEARKLQAQLAVLQQQCAAQEADITSRQERKTLEPVRSQAATEVVEKTAADPLPIPCHDAPGRRRDCRLFCHWLLFWTHGASRRGAGEGGAVRPSGDVCQKEMFQEQWEVPEDAPDRTQESEHPLDQRMQRATEMSSKGTQFLKDFLELHGATVLGGEYGIENFEAPLACGTKIREDIWQVVD